MELHEGPRVATIFARRPRSVPTKKASFEIRFEEVFMYRFAVFFLTTEMDRGGMTIKFCCRWQF